MSAAALALTERDFDAYEPSRATSNAFSRPRLELKQRALGWARAVVRRLHDIGIDVEVHASDEHPSVWNGHRVDCQWVFFWAEGAARAELDVLFDQRRGIAKSLEDPSPRFRHAFLALRLDFERVEVCLQLHPEAWADFETLRARLEDVARAHTLVEAIASLPEQFAFGLAGEQGAVCSGATRDGLLDLLERARVSSRACWLGWPVARRVAIEHSGLLDEQLGDALAALASVYRAAAWSPHDDPAGLGERLARMRGELARAAAERAAEQGRLREEADKARRETTERSRERTRERVAYDTDRARPTLTTLFKTPPAGEPERERTPAATASPAGAATGARRKTAAPEPTAARVAAAHGTAAGPPEALRAASDQPIDKGARVEVLTGPFAGRVGVVGDLDGRGGARVLLGLLSTRVALADLARAPEPAQRPPTPPSQRRVGPADRSGR
jgi:hypothetical protein